MTEKVKVSREVANFIEGYEANVNSTPGWEDHLIFEHSRTWMDSFDDVKEEALCMSEISPLELAEILTKGYEVEGAPKEIISQKIIDAWNAHEDETWKYDVGWRNGARFILNELGYKIKGIND